MINGKSVLAIIPARGGSKGVPGKNLRLFKGESLLTMTIKTARQSVYIDRLIVSSEDAEILSEAKKHGADVPFTRPIELAQDDTPGIEPVLHAIAQLEYYDYVILLQVTSPLRVCNDIDLSLEYCVNLNAPACVSIVKVEKHPYWMVTKSESQKISNFYDGNIPTRRQDLPEIYGLNGAIFIAKPTWLKLNKKFITAETVGFEMPKERSLDIDNEFDFYLLEAYSNY